MDAELTAAHCDSCYYMQADDLVDVPVRPVADAVDTFARDAVELVHIDLKFVRKVLEMLALYISRDTDKTRHKCQKKIHSDT